MTVKFKCEVIRTDKFSIELDENFLNEKWFEDFNKYFYDFEDLEELTEFIAQCVTRLGVHRFIERIGYILQNGEKPFGIDDDQINFGVNVIFNEIPGDQEYEVWSNKEASQ
ncbi:hypothetical protein EP56_12565 [Listeriaceae bacterium FSL A5-0209]|nr:hypothetical protein EP56_12565 [Listeriaceae bacterium FSL A5-0209]